MKLKRLPAWFTCQLGGMGPQGKGTSADGLTSARVRFSQVTSTIAHISQSTSLQSQNVMQVDDSLRHLERMAQANGQLAHDGQAATQRLYVETNNLVGVVDKFNTH